jgi:hypothetical protein
VYASVRRYAGNTELARELSSRQDDVRSVIAGISGFRAYYLIAAGGDSVTVSIFDDEAGATQSNEAAAAWLKENLPDLATTPPEISAGEVVFSL